jgi:LPXTG-motif cell wall-anchored protein
MDGWSTADESTQQEIRTNVMAHAIRYRLVTKFTSLLAVEEKIVNPGGSAAKAEVPAELPAGWQNESIWSAPATGTSDAFYRMLGLTLLLAGLALFFASRRLGETS